MLLAFLLSLLLAVLLLLILVLLLFLLGDPLSSGRGAAATRILALTDWWW